MCSHPLQDFGIAILGDVILGKAAQKILAVPITTSVKTGDENMDRTSGSGLFFPTPKMWLFSLYFEREQWEGKDDM